MIVYEFHKNKIYISSDIYKNKKKELSDELYSFIKTNTKYLINEFTKSNLVKKLLKDYSKKTGLEGYIILDAHGTNSNPWTFRDGNKNLNVQDWIDNIDGIALAILLYICNPKNRKINSKRSIVIHYNKDISSDELTHLPLNRLASKNTRIYFPNYGYTESCKIRKLIKEN